MDRSEIIFDFKSTKNVLYLMQRDQRILENHCIELGYELSYKNKSQFIILFDYDSVKANKLQKKFIKEGLHEMNDQCIKYNLIFQTGNYESIDKNIDLIIIDYSPLRENIAYFNELKDFCEKKKISLIRCDSHNVVPHFMLTKYKRTGKAVKTDLFKLWDDFVKEYKEIEKHKYNKIKNKNEFSKEIIKEKEIYFVGGYSNGMKEFEIFLRERFPIYDEKRNNPEYDALSNISPWIHTGQISALKLILILLKKYKMTDKNFLTFINEIFVWKETAEHFCYYESNYDNIKGALGWAQETLKKHKNDKKRIYTNEELEKAMTDDPLWNAGQKELLITGKMHGYVRMYWAKSLLKWSKDAEEALERALYLNDKYSLDGNDPNGYLGIMWSICGSMDRPWGEREIFGKIRSMKSFKCPKYLNEWSKKNINSYKIEF